MFTISNHRTAQCIAIVALMMADRAVANETVYQQTLRSTVCVLSEDGVGTGSLIDVRSRLVVTNYHVIQGSFDVLVLFPVFDDGKLVSEWKAYVDNIDSWCIKAHVVASDPRRDLALLELESVPDGQPALKLAKRGAQPGQQVHSIGNPGVSDALWVYASGPVRSVYNACFDIDEFHFDTKVVDTAAPLNPGDSGGPVVNGNGELVAIVQSIKLNANGFSTCIDVSELKALLAGHNKSVDQQLLKIVNQLGMPHQVLPDGSFVLRQGKKNNVSFYVTSQIYKHGSGKFREMGVLTFSVRGPIPSRVAADLKAENKRLGDERWTIERGDDVSYVLYRCLIPADAGADEMESQINEMLTVAYEMDQQIRSAAQQATAKKDRLRSVVGKWRLSWKRQTVVLHLNGDRTFAWQTDQRTLQGTYNCTNNTLVLTPESGTPVKGTIGWRDEDIVVFRANIGTFLMTRGI